MRNLKYMNMSLAYLVTWLVLLSLCKAKPEARTEAAALLKWKDSLTNQSVLKSWVMPGGDHDLNSTTASNPCKLKWYGITCNKDGSVIGINLAFMKIPGTLEKLDFTSFPNLLRLDLKVNQFTGTIPINIGNLSKLQYLDLSTNSLNGSLPLTLSNLTQVYELDVSRNNITGKLDPILFPDGTRKTNTGLINLKHLLLQDNELGGQIPLEIGNSEKLVLLALDGNYFSGHIPQTLGNLSGMTYLRLASNQLSGQIPQQIGTFSNLTDLRLQINQLSGTVPEGLGNLSSLTVLLLAENNFVGHLPQQVCGGGKLMNFSARDNFFTGPVPRSLRSCSTLFRVRLENNQLTGNIDQDFGEYQNLDYIDLSNNRLQGKLSPNWSKSMNLTLLKIAGNMIGGGIPEEILHLTKLGELDLSSNRLDGEIPAQLGRALPQLYKLNLKDNKLSGKIPVSIGELSNLVELDLSMNKLTGRIPEQIGDCFRLQTLCLGKNGLNGTIPYQIGNLVSLQNLLDFSYNSLVGEIPSQLGNLKQLENLDLSHNSLNGSIPNSLGDMLSLSAIDLSNNNLAGALPNRGIFLSASSEAFANNKDLCGTAIVQRLRPCNNESYTKGVGGNKGNKPVIALVPSLVGSLFLIIVFIGCCTLHCRKKQRYEPEDTLKTGDMFSIWHYDGKLVYEDIIEATEDFNDMYCIGVGGSGKVYKATLQSGQAVAVKKLNSYFTTHDAEIEEEMRAFKNEVMALTETRHRNIVKLHGFCFHKRHTFLVYEFMERGSLAEILSNDKKAKELDWIKRVNIVKGVAHALSYMHHDCVPPIIHRDISSKNILLNSQHEALVSDFGTAKILNLGSSNWSAIAGTYGYVAPELAYTAAMTEKIDVYSFGVLALEVVMGKHPGEFILALPSVAYQDMHFEELLDCRLSLPTDQKSSLSLLVKLALSCLVSNPQSRPSMQFVSQSMLEMKAV